MSGGVASFSQSCTGKGAFTKRMAPGAFKSYVEPKPMMPLPSSFFATR